MTLRKNQGFRFSCRSLSFVSFLFHFQICFLKEAETSDQVFMAKYNPSDISCIHISSFQDHRKEGMKQKSAFLHPHLPTNCVYRGAESSAFFPFPEFYTQCPDALHGWRNEGGRPKALVQP